MIEEMFVIVFQVLVQGRCSGRACWGPMAETRLTRLTSCIVYVEFLCMQPWDMLL